MADDDGGRIKRGQLYVRQIGEYIKDLQSSICTHRAVQSYIYNNTHDYLSVRRVCKHAPVARSYSLGQHF